MIEFSLVIAISLVILFFVIDVAVGLFRYALLAHSVTAVTRRAALDISPATDASSLVAELSGADSRIATYMQDTFRIDTTQYTFRSRVWREGAHCFVEAQGSFAYRCLICHVVSFEWPISSKSSTRIEDECFPAGGCS